MLDQLSDQSIGVNGTVVVSHRRPIGKAFADTSQRLDRRRGGIQEVERGRPKSQSDERWQRHRWNPESRPEHALAGVQEHVARAVELLQATALGQHPRLGPKLTHDLVVPYRRHHPI